MFQHKCLVSRENLKKRSGNIKSLVEKLRWKFKEKLSVKNLSNSCDIIP